MVENEPSQTSSDIELVVPDRHLLVTSAVPPNDRILVFGSFLVVAQAMQAKEALRKRPG
ncbi:hypothetical protein [Mycobacterium tuberculosis]|uniref:hypothetical protein n=1 Tax=Mycobacterium tuberculosis TaxID=1773 RepID=UPI00350F42AD